MTKVRVKRNANAVIVAVLLALAAVPPLLVLSERWFGNTTIRDLMKSAACNSAFLCGLLLPSYFILVWIFMFVVLALVFWLGAERIDIFKAQPLPAEKISPLQKYIALCLMVGGVAGVVWTIVRLLGKPEIVGGEYLAIVIFFVLGWVLLTVRVGAVWNLVRRYWKVGFAYLLGLAALTWLLFSYYARGQLSPFSFVLATAAILVLYWQRGNISPGYWLMLLAFVLYSLQLNAWHFSVVGDEMVFRGSAVEIAQDKSLDQILARLFNGTAVYGTHPYLSSVLLAPPLKIFDTLGFGWRMGSIYPSAFAVFLLYGFFGIFTKHRVAFAAAFLLAVSHYLMTFSRIGYNNTQALLAMAVLFLSAAWAVKFQSRIAFVVTGLALAFCFYVFPAAIYIPPVALWFVLLYHPPKRRAALLNWVAMLSTMLVLVVPLFFQPEYWTTKLLGTPFWNDKVTPTGLMWGQRIGTQALYAFNSFLYVVKETHHLRLAYVDGVTAILILVGLGVLLRRVMQDKFALFLVSSLFLFVLVGATHGTDAPPNTRMFLLLPWFAWIAAIGLEWLAAQLKFDELKPLMRQGVYASVLGVIFLANLYFAYDYNVRKPNGYLEFDSLLVRIAQNLNAQARPYPKSIVIVSESNQHYLPGLEEELQIGYTPVALKAVDAALAPEKKNRTLLDRNNVVLLSPRLSGQERNAYQEFLQANDYVECWMLGEYGEKRFTVWRAPAVPDMCEPQQLWAPVRFPDASVIVLVALGLVGGFVLVRHFEKRSAPAAAANAMRADFRNWKLPFATALRINSDSKASRTPSAPGSANTLTPEQAQGYTFELNFRFTIFPPHSKMPPAPPAELPDATNADAPVGDVPNQES